MKQQLTEAYLLRALTLAIVIAGFVIFTHLFS